MTDRPFEPIKDATYRRYGPGEAATPAEYEPGDFILTHSNSLYGILIRFGQGLRFTGRDRKFAWWNHAAMIVDKNGDLIEALDAGVRRTNLSKYMPTEYHLVHLGSMLTNETDRHESVAFASWSLGEPYGWTTIVSIALSLLTGCALSFGFDGQEICSGLVARALERTRAIFNRTPSHMMPADLAKYFNVEPVANARKEDRGSLPKRERFKL